MPVFHDALSSISRPPGSVMLRQTGLPRSLSQRSRHSPTKGGD